MNEILQLQLDDLKKYILEREYNGVTIEGSLKYIVFLSFGNSDSRANVCNGVSGSLLESWEKAIANLKKNQKKKKLNITWVKADVVTEINQHSLTSFKGYISKIKNNYFKEGIAFDVNFKLAFLEQEVNSNVFIHEVKNTPYKKAIAWKNVNFYLKSNTGLNLALGDDLVKVVYTFKTKGIFHDGKDCIPLGNQWLDNGRRMVKDLTGDIVYSIIEQSSEYLANQVYESGQFRYGYFPCFDKEIAHYNILRHASTTYSMVEAYEIAKSDILKKAIIRSLEFLLKDSIKLISCPDGIERGFVIEKSDNSSIKLGANAAAILAFAKYTEVFSDYRYLEVMMKLADGIGHFQNEDGSFVHVLNYPDLTLREAHRIIYYDGEATFALMRLYAVDKNSRWLEMVKKSFEFFITKDYWKYNDHWLSYCSYELFIHEPDKKYLEFNLKNAEGILDFCLTRETTFPTLLELLLATYNIIDRCKKENKYLNKIMKFDEKKLEAAIKHRAMNQLNGFLFPEVAMYFKVPKNIMGAFYIRHHSFRVRIDDIEHNLSGYCGYYKIQKQKRLLN